MNEDLKTKLTGLGLTEDQIGKLEDAGVTVDSDMSLLTAAEVQSTSGCGLVVAKKAAAAFAPVPTASATPTVTAVSFDVLPQVPSDENWLASFKVGGVLKFNKETVIGTVSAGLANRLGIYDLPEKIIDAMEKQAESLEEPVGEDFFRMQRALTERSYADIFAAIPGATGRYANQKRRKELLAKLDDNLWGALVSFHNQVAAWVDAYQKGFANPGLMFGAIASMVGGGGGVPPGMMAPPPTDVLRDGAEGVIQSINKIFAGTGIPVAMALAYDAQQIRQALDNPALPAQVGAANREQMLRQLGVAVTSDYSRLEANVKRYALGIIELPNVTAGQTELAYITALFQLGSQIPWDKLGGRGADPFPGDFGTRRVAGIGRTSRLDREPNHGQ